MSALQSLSLLLQDKDLLVCGLPHLKEITIKELEDWCTVEMKNLPSLASLTLSNQCLLLKEGSLSSSSLSLNREW